MRSSKQSILKIKQLLLNLFTKYHFTFFVYNIAIIAFWHIVTIKILKYTFFAFY